MKIGILGANGQVGTELCFILKNKNHEIIPIVRNKIGAAFLKNNKFNCRIADITKEDDAKNTLHDIDVVIIAAYMWPNFSISASENKRINKSLIQNATKYTKEQATVIYFSSIRAFSSKIDEDTPTVGFTPYYDKDKQELEEELEEACKKWKKKGYTLRLGHVCGKNQALTKTIQSMVNNKSTIYLQVAPKRKANILHTVTLAEAIARCIARDMSPRVYTVVNAPQWSWGEVFQYYSQPNTEIICQGREKGKKELITKKLITSITKYLIKHYARLRKYIPQKTDEYFQYKYRRGKILSEIADLEKENQPIRLAGFSYKPAPGPYIPTLTRTKDLLKTHDVATKIFSTTSS